MSARPRNLHPSRSFSRLDAAPKSPLSRSRASTLQGPHATDMLDPLKNSIVPEEDESVDGDVFVKKEEGEEQGTPPQPAPDVFLESLSAKVHPSPPTAETLSDLFQDFYQRASPRINTHIATLSARLTSETFLSQANKGSAPSSRAGSIRKGSDPSAEQQMLSASEMTDRKKARKSLEAKRASLEEAVERAVCEKVYDRIWRHRTTDDEERDHKLRSRTAALSLVGIGLKELLMTGEEMTEEERTKAKEKEPEIREFLSAARQDIMKMNHEKYPLGKVLHLTAAHKSIVDALSKIFPATSSADEILPTLIYALITLPPAHLNVISDLKFIQRFRGSSRMDGETAYCLVNLEAAISFLETVDLSSIRAEEGNALERTNSRPSTPKTEVTPMLLGLSDAPDLVQTPATPTSRSNYKEPSSPTTTKIQRRLSNLVQAQTNRIESASDAVRESILDSADQALGRINNTLDTSFKFFFGGLRERDPNNTVVQQPALPKTLEEVRELVSSPTRGLQVDDDDRSVSAASEDDRQEPATKQDLNTRMSDLFAGKRQVRDRSADSARSGGSNSARRVAFASKTVDEKTPSPAVAKTDPAPTTPSAVDSLRNLGNSFNPLNTFRSVNVLPRFGRAVSSASTPTLPSPTPEQSKTPPVTTPEPLGRTTTNEVAPVDEKGAKAIAALEQMKKTAPPLKKFRDAKDAQDLKLKEVDELLKEYQRLVAAMSTAIQHL
ncbi:hypothetical protein E8E12_000321 [Didymella heteroderae]|uniref:VPS9 domain-containing protein n=1 Tax=Didymella heteroderae TaxID=1769908 RepID=A0A9P5BYN0_9PLEO|nr:hypothetical protein E8E12_000321 [Didymella heteroderae]